MNFFVVGVSHHQAPVAVREKLAAAETADRLYGLWERGGDLSESLLLSTCNRLEFLAVSDRPELARQAVLDELAVVSGCPLAHLTPHLHEYAGLEAARHLFRVAASLDSLVLGEPQILGQVKTAFREALKRRRAGALINKLMHRSFRAAKRVRSETSLAGGPVSVAGAATRLALTLKGGDLSETAVLILGAGPTAVLALDNLRKKSPAALTILNRTRAKAEFIAQKYKISSLDWAELKPALAWAD
jgi:glutamyl-tRNA reductase